MTLKRELTVSLVDWEVRCILESISREMMRLKTIAEESNDEDEAIDAGNDYLDIAGLSERLEAEAKEIFGAQIISGHD